MRIKNNKHHAELATDVYTSNIFNVANLIAYKATEATDEVPSYSRTSSFHVGEDDADEYDLTARSM